MTMQQLSSEIKKMADMNENAETQQEYFEQIKNLCKVCGIAIDKIARQFNINQNLVAKLFIETMQTILSEVEK